MKTSKDGVDLIKKFEGCELTSQQCSAKVWTIGYGHTSGVVEGVTIDQNAADKLLKDDLEEFESYVSKMVKKELNQNQFNALVAWTFNLGPTNLKTSTLLERLNNGDYEGVPYEMKRWNKAGGKVLNRLVRRREAESLLFQGEPWEHV